jgi:hypothetical protein
MPYLKAMLLVMFFSLPAIGCNCTGVYDLEDTDGDGLLDHCEDQVFMTNPRKADSDNDTIWDDREDHDDDGCDNLYEQMAVPESRTVARRCFDYTPEPGECE